jgi:rare lipoprotein A
MLGSYHRWTLSVLGAAGFLAAGCAETQLVVYAAKRATNEIEAMVSPEPEPPAASEDAEAEDVPLAPASSPHYKVGDPYEVAGIRYYPRVDPDYDETGIGSWYGLPFHGRDTANGESYDMNELTAAHKTLPMPTMVRVTNLENGRSLVLRVNDRGPFVNGRIIDVSRRAAQLLGFEITGTAKVRVQAMSADGAAVFADKAITTDEERAAVPSAPREPVEVDSLAPPEGISKSPAAARNLPAAVNRVPVGATDLFIQAGAFTYRANATRLARRLLTLGPTQVTSVVIDGTEFFRVRIGPLAGVDEADLILEDVYRMGFREARIVVE